MVRKRVILITKAGTALTSSIFRKMLREPVRKRLESVQSGHVLKVLASDPMSAIDMPHFCNEQNYELLTNEKDGELYVFRIKRK